MNQLKLIDIHTHLIPGVDDGSRSFDESIDMLSEMINQGVTDVFVTPHVHSNATKQPWTKQVELFKELEKRTKHLNVNLYLGAEVRYRSNLQTNYQDYKIRGTNYILLEFSWSTKEDVHGIIKSFQEEGLKPIVAHVERYSYLKINDYKKMKNNGVLLQVNSGALIGKGREHWQKNANLLIKEKLADFVASDTHNMDNRFPTLIDAYEVLKNKIDEEYLKDLFRDNALKIINEMK